jgi:5-methylcytosine-specific restriction endonuclease McrA
LGCNNAIPVRNEEKVTTVRKKKFCSISCSNKYKHIKKTYSCIRCNITISIGWTTKKYCSSCFKKSNNYKDWSSITLGDVFKDRTVYQAHARVRSVARSFYSQSGRDKVCNKCSYSKFVEICHIKPLSKFSKDTPISVINSTDNLVALCPNCHWEHDHGLF